MPKNVVIVGMPRSGTSLTAAMFARQGFFVADESGNKLRQGDEFNKEGYFESSDLIDANVRVFSRAGFEHHNTWKFDPIGEESADHIGDLEYSQDDAELVRHFGANEPWVWKDPRLCYTLSYWWQYLKSANAVVLLLHRSHEDIHRSFERIGWRTGSKSDRLDVEKRSHDHIAAAKKAIDSLSIPYCEYRYNEYKTDPQKVLKKINDLVGLDLNSNDIGFRAEFDHSSGRGAMERRLESLGSALPRPFARLIKKVAPRRLLSWLMPSRFS